MQQPSVQPSIITLCTGNAARSVMAAAALARHVPTLAVTSAGTLVVEGQPISWRTRDALAALGLEAPGHRSRQAGIDLGDADLVIALAPEHVEWVRRTHPEVGDRTATLKRLCRDLPPAGEPLASRLAQLQLGSVALEGWEDVSDPGGGDAEVFAACAREVATLVEELAPRLAC